MLKKSSRLFYLFLILSLLVLAGCATGGDVDDGGETEPSGPSDDADLGPTERYTSADYQFGLSYPQDFNFREVPAAERDQLQPTPDAWFTFGRAGAEPPDLELRVFAASGAGSLEDWLTTNNLMPADGGPLPSFDTGNVSGVELCGGTMIGPGCAYYVLAGNWLYQMIPASLEGEAMIHTFEVTS